jgi:hypothetical protein
MTPKFLATRSAQGIPNVVPCISLQPADDLPDTLFFGNFLLRKSIRNLEQDSRVGTLVVTPELRGWMLQGDFVEFQRTGPFVERQMSGPLLRYNAYTGIRNAGILKVRSIQGEFVITKLQVARDYALTRLATLRGPAAGGTTMPLPVRREFGKMAAVKVLAWVGEDGYPVVAPVLSLQPAGKSTLVCRRGQLPMPPEGASVASNVLTLEAISYQAKGEWSLSGNIGAVKVGEVYAGGPPYPGGRIV